MRKKLLLVTTAVVSAAVWAPIPSASAICDTEFFERTGYCSQCEIRQDHERSPQHEVICPQ